MSRFISSTLVTSRKATSSRMTSQLAYRLGQEAGSWPSSGCKEQFTRASGMGGGYGDCHSRKADPHEQEGAGISGHLGTWEACVPWPVRFATCSLEGTRESVGRVGAMALPDPPLVSCF